jgi:hypothetical protein
MCLVADEETMDKVEAVRQALAERGDLSAQELAALVRARYGVDLDPRFVPVIKAMLKDKQMLALTRQTQRQTAEGSVC